MSMNRVLNELRSNEGEFITSNTIKSYSNKLYYNVMDVIKYFISQGYVLKILKDTFYVKNINEIRNKKLKFSQYELLSKALAFKNVDNWYFGLHTALKFDLNEENNVFFNNNPNIDYVINDKFSVDNPIIFNGDKFSFLAFKKELLNFGIKDNGKYRYSNLEKTILDYIYLYTSNNVGEGKILLEVSKYKNVISKERILNYSKRYPAKVKAILEKTIFKGKKKIN